MVESVREALLNVLFVFVLAEGTEEQGAGLSLSWFAALDDFGDAVGDELNDFPVAALDKGSESFGGGLSEFWKGGIFLVEDEETGHDLWQHDWVYDLQEIL
jgi:hypothetical protein